VPNRHLDVAVACAKTKATGETIAWTVKGVEGDISPLVAMTLARWSYVTRSHLLDGNPSTTSWNRCSDGRGTACVTRFRGASAPWRG
jgi:hypothetical protein